MRIRFPWILFGLALVVHGMAARAQNSNFSLTGKITASTCDWDGDALTDVALPAVDVSKLRQGQAVGLVPFSLSLTRCDTDLKQVTFTITGNPDPLDSQRYRNAGSAAGVAFELQSRDGATVTADGSHSQRSVPVNSGAARLDLQVGYWQVAPGATPGSVESMAVVNLSYN
nr:fimbrial protein [Dyella sp. ASV24]